MLIRIGSPRPPNCSTAQPFLQRAECPTTLPSSPDCSPTVWHARCKTRHFSQFGARFRLNCRVKPSSGSYRTKMSNVLDVLDQTMFDLGQATGSETLLQCVWVY